jgi:hypothetical protein
MPAGLSKQVLLQFVFPALSLTTQARLNLELQKMLATAGIGNHISSMTVHDLNLKSLGSGRIFPSEIEDTFGYAYHGTRSAHSESIETSGLIPRKALTSEDEWNTLIRLGKMVDASATAQVKSFRASTRVNFFALSESALWYTQWKGGQGVHLHAKPLAEKIRTSRDLKLSIDEARIMDEVWAKLCRVQEGTPVVYAVDLNGLENACYNRSALAVQIEGGVDPKRLVAKINAVDFTDYALINAKALIPKAKILINPECKHFVSKLPLCD